MIDWADKDIRVLKGKIDLGIDSAIMRNAHKGYSWRGMTKEDLHYVASREENEWAEACQRDDLLAQKQELLDWIWSLYMLYDLTDRELELA